MDQSGRILSVKMTLDALADRDCVRRRLACPVGELRLVGERVDELRELDEDMAVFMTPTAEGEMA